VKGSEFVLDAGSVISVIGQQLDFCIIGGKNADQIESNYNYCKGCGICAVVCPKGAIEMVLGE